MLYAHYCYMFADAVARYAIAYRMALRMRDAATPPLLRYTLLMRVATPRCVAVAATLPLLIRRRCCHATPRAIAAADGHYAAIRHLRRRCLLMIIERYALPPLYC